MSSSLPTPSEPDPTAAAFDNAGAPLPDATPVQTLPAPPGINESPAAAPGVRYCVRIGQRRQVGRTGRIGANGSRGSDAAGEHPRINARHDSHSD